MVSATRPSPSPTLAAVSMPPPWRIIVLVAGLLLGVAVITTIFEDARRVLGWAVAAALVAFILSPAVRLLDRKLPRGLAIAATFVAVAALGAGVNWLYTTSLLDQVDQIRRVAPEIATDVEDRDDRIGEVAREIGLAEQVSELTERLQSNAGTAGDAARSAAESVPPYFVSMILTVFLLIFGPRMIEGAISQLRPDRQPRVRAIARHAGRRSQRYIWASIGQAVVSASAIAVVATALDLPAVGLLALFGGVAAFVPYLGVILGWIPMLVLGLGTAPFAAVAVAGLVGVALQLAEWWWWRPLIDSRSLYVGPAVPIVVAFVGFGVYGLGGALYGCVLAVIGLAVVDQVTPGDESLPTPIDEHSEALADGSA